MSAKIHSSATANKMRIVTTFAISGETFLIIYPFNLIKTTGNQTGLKFVHTTIRLKLEFIYAHLELIAFFPTGKVVNSQLLLDSRAVSS